MYLVDTLAYFAVVSETVVAQTELGWHERGRVWQISEIERSDREESE